MAARQLNVGVPLSAEAAVAETEEACTGSRIEEILAIGTASA
jgi:hypothetical protein